MTIEEAIAKLVELQRVVSNSEKVNLHIFHCRGRWDVWYEGEQIYPEHVYTPRGERTSEDLFTALTNTISCVENKQYNPDYPPSL